MLYKVAVTFESVVDDLLKILIKATEQFIFTFIF